MFLDIPSWSSDRDPQRSFKIPRLQKFRPYGSPYVFGGRAASDDQPDVSVGFNLRDSTFYGWLREALVGLVPIASAKIGTTPNALIGFLMSPTYPL